MGIDMGDNELITLEIIHHYVEVLDRYFGNVCELDLIFNFHKVRLFTSWRDCMVPFTLEVLQVMGCLSKVLDSCSYCLWRLRSSCPGRQASDF